MAKIIVPGEEATAQNQPTGPQSATYEQIVAACDGATSDFIVRQLAAKATVQQAQAAYNAELKAEAAKAKKEAQEAKEEAKKSADALKASKKRPGVKALGEPGRKENDKNKAEDDDEDEKMEDEKDDDEEKSEDEGEPAEEDEPDDVKQRFNRKVRHYMQTRKVPRSGSADHPGAIQLIAINHPRLHKKYLKATNPGRKMARLLDEKFDEVA